MAQLFANNAKGRLQSAITDVQTSITLHTGQGALFPSPTGGDFFTATLFQYGADGETNHEIVRCTARSGDVLTVTRAQEGTTGRAFDATNPIELRVTRDTVNYLNNASVTTATADINGGTIDGTTIGASTRAAGNFTTLDANGNVTLGDASTDTVTVNGYMGVGGAANAQSVVLLSNSAGTTATQIGFNSRITASASGTTGLRMFSCAPATAAASFTVPYAYGYSAFDAIKGAGSTITSLHGVYVADQTQGTNNYGITSEVSSGANKWNIYASGTAANYFAGNVGIGTTAFTNGVFVVNTGASGSAPVTIGQTGNDTFLELQRYTGTASNFVGHRLKSTLSSGNFVIESAASGVIGSQTWTERLRIDSSGNVGIGTSSPAGVLHTLANNLSIVPVFERATASTTGYIPSVRMLTTSVGDMTSGFAGNLDFEVKDNAGVVNPIGRIAWERGSADNSGALVFFTADTGVMNQRLRIDSSGGLITKPAVNGHAVFNEDGVDADFRIESDTNTHAFFLEGSSGNVGIGTSSPGARLHVYSGATGVQMRVGDIVAGIDPIVRIQGKNVANTTNRYVDLKLNADTGLFTISAPDNNTPDIDALNIDSSGNVGIGTTAPDRLLHLSATGTATATAMKLANSGDASNGIVQFVGSTFGTTTRREAMEYFLTGANTKHIFYTDSTERLRIDSSGQVGVGLTPTARNNTRLQIVDGIGFPATQVASSDANTLDDYEEGVFTPVFSNDAGDLAASTSLSFNASGRYTKIGNVVFFRIVASTSGTITGTASSPVRVALPFTSSASVVAVNANASNDDSASYAACATKPTSFQVEISSAFGHLKKSGAGAQEINFLTSDLAASGNANRIVISGHYEV